MLAARADFTIEGPGVRVHVHGDGPTLVADMRGDLRAAARAVGNIPHIVRLIKTLSQTLRLSGLRVNVRVGGRIVMWLG